MLKVFLTIATLGIEAGAFLVGRNIPAHSQLEFFTSLLNVASIILAVTGAWLAIVFPNVLTTMYKADYENRDADLKKVRRLFAPMIISSVVVASTLVIQLLALVLHHNESLSLLLTPHTSTLRGLMFATIVGLGLSCISALVYCLAPAVSYKDDLRRQDERDKKIAAITQLTQKHK